MNSVKVHLVIMIEERCGVSNEKTLWARKWINMPVQPFLGMTIIIDDGMHKIEDIVWDDNKAKLIVHLHPDGTHHNRAQAEMLDLKKKYELRNWTVSNEV